MQNMTTHFLLVSFLVTPLCAMEIQEQTLSRLDPLGDGISSLELSQVNGDDLQIVNAARVSYARHSEKFSEADQRILTQLISSGHESPFEQTFLQYHVKLPIFVARQWMRHRVGVSYNEQSARYTKMKEEFYVPTDLRIKSEYHTSLEPKQREERHDILRSEYTKAVQAAAKTYDNLLAMGVPRELARGVLPVSLYTQFVFACNMRSLFHFVGLRADSHAQWEIQQYAKGMLKLAQKHFPASVAIWCNTNKVPWLDEKPAEEKPAEKKEAKSGDVVQAPAQQ